MKNGCDQMRKSLNKEKTMFIFLTLFFWGAVLFILIDIICEYPSTCNDLMGVLSFIISVYLCYLYRYNIGLFIVMIFMAYTNYSILMGIYIFPSVRPNNIFRQFSTQSFGIGIVCIFIFELTLLLVSYKLIIKPHIIDFSIKGFIDNIDYNKIIAIGGLIAYLLMFVMNFRFGTGGRDRGESSPLNEYKNVVAIISSYYSGRKNVYKYSWIIVISITTVLTLLSGNRVRSFGSVIFLIFFWLSDKINYKTVLVFLPIAVVVLAAVGFLRGSFSLDNMGLGDSFSRLLDDKFTYEGAIYAYGPSLATIELTSITSISEKLSLLWDHIVYIFTIGRAQSLNPDLSIWSGQYYFHYHGFISPCYFYFWVGYLGPVLFALLVNVYNKLYQKSMKRKLVKFRDKAKYVISLCFICNVARWYTYGPMALLRSMFVAFVMFSVVYAFDYFTQKRKKGISNVVNNVVETEKRFE